MTLYVTQRLAQFFFVVAGALLAVFFVLYVIADPVSHMVPLGSPQSVLDETRAEYGFDQSLPTRLWDFVSHAVRGDFGDSLWLGTDALGAAVHRLPATLWIAVPAVVIGGGLGMLFAVTTARRPTSMLAQVLHVVSFGIISIADFWLAIMFILVFAVQFELVPTGGTAPMHLAIILPITILSFKPFANVYQLTRSTMISEYGKQYVMTARAQGVPESTVARRHVLRNALPPVVTLEFYELSRALVGAAVIIEVVFAWPGMGRLAVDALTRGDVFLVQAVVAVTAVTTASLSLIADLLGLSLDPRARALVGTVR